MFCPKCATQNIEGASFCRSCGANISLIPHALNGQLPTAQADDAYNRGGPCPPSMGDMMRSRKGRRKRAPTIDEGIRHLIMGIAFVVVSILVGRYSPGGWTWWYWLLIPASTLIGRGISELIRAKQDGTLGAAQQSPQLQAPNPMQIPSSRSTNELMPPVPSVTEGTTRHLGAEAPTRTFDSLSGSEKPS
jgi:hypothetical protein